MNFTDKGIKSTQTLAFKVAEINHFYVFNILWLLTRRYLEVILMTTNHSRARQGEKEKQEEIGCVESNN